MQCEKIEVPMRDGEYIPLLMVYDSRTYTASEQENNWIFFTNGFDSTKTDLVFQPSRLSLTQRGIVCAFPMLRGK
jgi:protease II